MINEKEINEGTLNSFLNVNGVHKDINMQLSNTWLFGNKKGFQPTPPSQHVLMDKNKRRQIEQNVHLLKNYVHRDNLNYDENETSTRIVTESKAKTNTNVLVDL